MFTDTRLGNNPRHYNRQPNGAKMIVPPDVLNCTAFLGAPVPNQPDGIDLRCTAFFVALPLSNGLSDGYLVTVKHHADKLEGTSFGVRVNVRSGGTATIWVIESDAKWWRHPTEPECNDVAVMPFKLPDWAAHTHVGANMFVNDEIMQ